MPRPQLKELDSCLLTKFFLLVLLGILVLSPLATVWQAEEGGTECGINSAPLTLFKPNLFASP